MLYVNFEVQLQNINEVQTFGDLEIGNITESNCVPEEKPSMDKAASVIEQAKHSLFEPYDDKLVEPRAK